MNARAPAARMPAPTEGRCKSGIRNQARREFQNNGARFGEPHTAALTPSLLRTADERDETGAI